MLDSRELSERYDLSYIRHRQWPQSTILRLSILAVMISIAAMGYYALTGNETMYSAGPLTHAHDMFAEDCSKCHQADVNTPRSFFTPVQDALCLECHMVAQHHEETSQFVGMLGVPGHPEVSVAAGCAMCHVEHRGRNHDLLRMPDDVCVSCHADLNAHGRRAVPGGGR